MRSPTTVPFLIRAIVAFVFIIAAALLFGVTLVGPAPQSAEATFLTQIKKLLASDAQALDSFGENVAVSGDTAVVGAFGEDTGAPWLARPTSSSVTKAVRITGAR